MTARISLALLLAGAFLLPFGWTPPAPACCSVYPRGKPVLNADQTVIIIWDAATKTQHFIRQASFKGEADHFGFLVPTPSQPELDESGDGAFSFLLKLTEPEVKYMKRSSGGMGCGCGSSGGTTKATTVSPTVRVLEQKLVAGMNAAVLETDDANALVSWLKEHGYFYSPEVAAWAKPYVEGGWKFTALKVAKSEDAAEKNSGRQSPKSVAAPALRLTFKTDRPLFPYREPDPGDSAGTLGAKNRLLRVYFIADARYQGELAKEPTWTGVWSDKVAAGDRKKTLDLLKLPETAGPGEWWLTEFEHTWPYRVAPADVYFSRNPDQKTLKRPPDFQYVSAPGPVDVMACALAAALIVPPLVRRVRRR